MKLLNTKKNSFEKSFNLILNSKRSQAKDNIKIVQKIINNVRKLGDKSLIQYTAKFDKIKLRPVQIELDKKLINNDIFMTIL